MPRVAHRARRERRDRRAQRATADRPAGGSRSGPRAGSAARCVPPASCTARVTRRCHSVPRHASACRANGDSRPRESGAMPPVTISAGAACGALAIERRQLAVVSQRSSRPVCIEPMITRLGSVRCASVIGAKQMRERSAAHGGRHCSGTRRARRYHAVKLRRSKPGGSMLAHVSRCNDDPAGRPRRCAAGRPGVGSRVRGPGAGAGARRRHLRPVVDRADGQRVLCARRRGRRDPRARSRCRSSRRSTRRSPTAIRRARDAALPWLLAPCDLQADQGERRHVRRQHARARDRGAGARRPGAGRGDARARSSR